MNRRESGRGEQHVQRTPSFGCWLKGKMRVGERLGQGPNQLHNLAEARAAGALSDMENMGHKEPF